MYHHDFYVFIGLTGVMVRFIGLWALPLGSFGLVGWRMFRMRRFLMGYMYYFDVLLWGAPRTRWRFAWMGRVWNKIFPEEDDESI